MRRLTRVLLVLLLIFALSVPVSAATTVTELNSTINVTDDGRCQVSITATISLESVPEKLVFPLPAGASRISLNGSRVSGKAVGDIVEVDLFKKLPRTTGSHLFTLSYQVGNRVAETDNGLQLQVPLLSGFGYSVQKLSFMVILPSQNTEKPAFSSGYHQSNIEKDLRVTYSGLSISGTSLKELKDHETLVMFLPVTEQMFPQNRIMPPSLEFCKDAMLVCAALAFLYWLLFLRCLPPRRTQSTTAPEGCTAGEIGSVLCGTGADLTMMVFSWAQLGYLNIDAMGQRVILYRRMEMGNERSAFERKYFEKLFRGRRSVDTGSLHYATLSRELFRRRPKLPTYFHRRSGSVRPAQFLCAGMALFAGVGIGISMASGSVLQWFWAIVMGALAFFSGLKIQFFAEGLFLRRKYLLRNSLIVCGAWLMMSMLVGQTKLGFLLCLTQILSGFFLYFGGRRTEAGKTAMSQILGLRRFLRGVRKDDLQRITATQPEFFHAQAPYAIALGVQRSFAKHFGKRRISYCPYITLDSSSSMTAAEWCSKMEQIVAQMEHRQRRLLTEKLLRFLKNIRK